MNIKPLYEAAKQFVDEYEHKEHERRHEAQAVPVNWSIERGNAYHALTEAIFKRETLTTIQKAAITFADICNREERQKKPKLDRAWSPEKHQAYHRLLDDFIGHKHYDEIVADARRLAAVCEREEHEQPKIGEVYRDIFGNMYLIIGINDEKPVKKSFVTLIYFNVSGDLRSSTALSVPLEDFMNPTFKKE